VIGVFQTLAVTLEVFLHNGATFGERYFGFKTIMGIPLIAMFPIFFPTHDPGPLSYFLLAYIVLAVVARLSQLIRRWRGENSIHTRYSGRPYLMLLFPKCNEVTVKRIEPVIVFVLSYALYPACPPLCGYLMTASLGLVVSVFMSEAYARARALDIKDATIEQKDLAERFRKMQD
jgi:hypothetical protein